MPYDKRDFQNMMRGNADALFAARETIGVYIDALKSGYANNILPAPGAKQENVNQKVQQIDNEWNRELHRAKRHQSFVKLNLSNDLNEAQKLALIDHIHEVLHGKPKSW